jgi:hypothetical protein
MDFVRSHFHYLFHKNLHEFKVKIIHLYIVLNYLHCLVLINENKIDEVSKVYQKSGG